MKRKVLGAKCTVCGHEDRPQIELAIVNRVSKRALAKRFDVSTDSLYRHARNHIPPQLRQKLMAGPDLGPMELENLKRNESEKLLSNLVVLRQRLFANLDLAEECGDAGMVARLAAQLHTNFEIVARLLGDLGTGGTNITNNILIAPQFIELRAALVKALRPFPQAARAVAATLHRIESKAAEQMKEQSQNGVIDVE